MELIAKGLSRLSVEDCMASARFIMSIPDDIISGNMNPSTEEGMLEMKKKIEYLFRRDNAEKAVISLSKSGEIKNNSEYFETLLQEMKENYPEVIVDDMFSMSFDPYDLTKNPETRAMSMLMSFRYTPSTFVIINQDDMISGDLESLTEEEQLTIRSDIEKMFQKSSKVKINRPVVQDERFTHLLDEMKQKYPKVEIAELFGISSDISITRPSRPAQLSYAQRKRLKNNPVKDSI